MILNPVVSSGSRNALGVLKRAIVANDNIYISFEEDGHFPQIVLLLFYNDYSGEADACGLLCSLIGDLVVGTYDVLVDNIGIMDGNFDLDFSTLELTVNTNGIPPGYQVLYTTISALSK